MAIDCPLTGNTTYQSQKSPILTPLTLDFLDLGADRTTRFRGHTGRLYSHCILTDVPHSTRHRRDSGVDHHPGGRTLEEGQSERELMCLGNVTEQHSSESLSQRASKISSGLQSYKAPRIPYL